MKILGSTKIFSRFYVSIYLFFFNFYILGSVVQYIVLFSLKIILLIRSSLKHHFQEISVAIKMSEGIVRFVLTAVAIQQSLIT